MSLELRFRADRLSVEPDTDRHTVTLIATALGDDRELKIDIDPVRIPWLVEQLLQAKVRAEKGGR